MKKAIYTIGLATLLASASQASQEQLASSIKAARDEATQTTKQLATTMTDLNALTKQQEGDLRPAYETFAADITNTEAAAVLTQKRVEFMQGEGQGYFDDWQTNITGIANQSVQKQAQKRLDAAKNNYTEVIDSLKEASDKFKPFLSDLNDIQKVLATDITAGGVKSVKSSVSDANWYYKSVNKAINKALEGMGNMEKSLSSTAD